MQLLLLKYREDIIAAKVAQEQTLETLQSKILFLKDQVSSEQEEKTRIEEALTQEINSLQERLGKGRWVFEFEKRYILWDSKFQIMTKLHIVLSGVFL